MRRDSLEAAKIRFIEFIEFVGFIVFVEIAAPRDPSLQIGRTRNDKGG